MLDNYPEQAPNSVETLDILSRDYCQINVGLVLQELALPRLITKLTKLEQKAKEAITNFFEEKIKLPIKYSDLLEDNNFIILQRCIIKLQKNEWLMQYDADSYLKIISSLENYLIEFIDNKIKQINGTQLNLRNFTGLGQTFDNLIKLEALEFLQKLIPNFKTKISSTKGRFQRKLTNICREISSIYYFKPNHSSPNNLNDTSLYLNQKINFLSVEQALCFVQECFQIFGEINKNIQEEERKIRSYIERYFQDIYESISQIFELISTAETSDKLLSAYIQYIYSNLRRLHKLKISYPMIYILLKKQNIWQVSYKNEASIIALYHSFSAQLNKFEAFEDWLKLKNKLEIVNNLYPLDVFLPEGRKFHDLYCTYTSKFNQSLSKNVERIYKLINEQDYYQLKHMLTLFLEVSDSPATCKRIGRIKEDILYSILTLVSKTQANAVILGSTLSLDYISKNISNNLIKLGEAEEYLIHLLDKEILEARLSALKEFLSLRINKFIKTTLQYLKNNNFRLVKERMELTEDALFLLRQFILENTVNYFEDAKKEIELYIKELINHYRQFPVEEYNMHPPRIILEQFSEIIELSEITQGELEEFKSLILQKIFNLLNESRIMTCAFEEENQAKEVRLSKILICEFALRALPENMSNALERELMLAKISIDKESNRFPLTYPKSLFFDNSNEIRASSAGKKNYLHSSSFSILPAVPGKVNSSQDFESKRPSYN